VLVSVCTFMSISAFMKLSTPTFGTYVFTIVIYS
jgi:hypothetical protein